jgi:starvation-inducible DNA-binding protein
MDIGIDDKTRGKIADGLAHLLADSYTLYLTTHGFHWNVTGPMFNTLHADVHGPSTRNCGARWTRSPNASARWAIRHRASYAQFVQAGEHRVPDAPATSPKALTEMVRQPRSQGQEAVARTARGHVPRGRQGR